MLNREEIKKLIKEQGIVKDFCDLDIQLNPSGFDLTASQVFVFDSPGASDFYCDKIC